MLSKPAQFADAAMLEVKNLNYDSWQTIYFQRTTVIVTELVLAYALYLFVLPAMPVSTADNAQFRQILAIQLKEAITRRGNLDTSLSRPAHHRSHSFPVQRVPLRHPHSLNRPCTEIIGPPDERHHLRRTALPQAHLPLPGTSLLRLSPASLLSWPEISLRHSNSQLHQARTRYWHRGCAGLWSVRVPRANSSGIEQALSLQPRALPRILGAQCMGDVLV